MLEITLNSQTCPQTRTSAIPAVTFRQCSVVFNSRATKLLSMKNERIAFKLLMDKTIFMYFDRRNGFLIKSGGRKQKKYFIHNKALVESIKNSYGGHSACFEIGEFKEGGWILTKI